jgi:hypothetical protein
MAEEVGTLVWREAQDNIAERVPECLNGSQCLGAQKGFEFGKGLLDRVQIGTVGWQVKQSGTGGFNRLADPGDLVGTEIVHDDDVATCQRGNQHLLDIGKERLAVDRSIEHARGDQAILAQAGYEGGGLPVPMGYCINQSVAHRGPAIEPDHVGLGPGLIDEDQLACVQLRLVLAPFRPGLGDVRSILLGGPERLFFSDKPSSFNVCQISPTLAAT